MRLEGHGCHFLDLHPPHLDSTMGEVILTKEVEGLMTEEAEVLVTEGDMEECIVMELYLVLRLVEMDVEMVKALLLIMLTLLMLLLLVRCVVLTEEAHHLFDKMPQRVPLPIQRRGDYIKTNQTTKHALRIARLRQYR